MKVKVSLIVTAVSILKTIDTTKMKLSVSYKVKQVLNKCENILVDFEERRVDLAKKHGTLSEDKTHYLFSDEPKKLAFQKKMQAMMEDEMDIDIKPIPVKLLDNYLDIEPVNVPYVEWFISGLD